MIETVKSIDQRLFFFLNGMHSPFFDSVMYWGTKPIVWLPLFMFLLFVVIRKYRWQTLWILLFATLMVLVSDQLSNIIKDLVARPRPTHEPGLSGIHTVLGYTGGQYGFYSAHASTTMAIAVFMIILLQIQNRYYTLLMLCWAFFMAYTRIYLGVHYPADMLAGWLAGGLIGWGSGWTCRWFVCKDAG